MLKINHLFIMFVKLCNKIQALSQKLMLGDSFEGNVDLFLWNHSANHSPGAVDELIFYGVCKPTFMRANYKHTR